MQPLPGKFLLECTRGTKRCRTNLGPSDPPRRRATNRVASWPGRASLTHNLVPPMANYTLHHIHHEAADVDAAAEFYVQNFAGEITERTERQGVQWARVLVGGVKLNITDRAHVEVGLKTYRGLDHFGIHTSDFDETIAQLRANGVPFYVEPTSPRPGTRIAFVSGPDNVKIEVLCIAPPS